MKILEGIRKGTGTGLLDELIKGYLISCLETYRIEVVGCHRILVGILLHLRINLSIGRLLSKLCDLTDAPVLDFPAILDLALKTVTIGYGNITHVVSKGCNHQML